MAINKEESNSIMNKTIVRFLSALMIVLFTPISPELLSMPKVNAQELGGNYDNIPPLLITEIVPDSTDIGDADGYEFIEVYNNTDQPLNFKDYQIIYRYPVGPQDDLFWIPNERDVEIAPGATLVLWIQNNENKETTVDDFNANYGTSLIENEEIVKMPGGMSNQRMRDILIRTNTGEEIVMAQYNKGVWDVAENMGVFYQYPQDSSTQMMKVSAGEKPATPGIVEQELVPEQPVSLDADSSPTIEDQTLSSQPMDNLEVRASGDDDFLLSTMTLYYKNETDEEYNSLNLELDPEDGLFHHTVPVQDLIGVEKLDYYLEATNGLNTTKTDVRTIDITAAENNVSPPLLITEIVPDSSNVNGADGYEFIEVYNNTDQMMNFGNYSILYRYLTGTPDAVWFKDLTEINIEPGGNFVLWVDNGKNGDLTVADFNANYDTKLVENVDIVKAAAGGGMANGAKRDMIVATKTGQEVAVAGYNHSGPDSAPDMGILYHFPFSSNRMIKVSSQEQLASPGTVEKDLVPEELIAVNPELGPIIDNQTENQSVKQGDSVQITANVQDNLLVSAMTMYYKHSNDEAYQAVNLTRDQEDGLFRHTIDIEEDAAAGSIHYYFVATNGVNETESTNYTIDIEIENIPDAPVLHSPKNGATNISTNPELSVNVSNPAGGKLDVGFYQGRSYNTSQSNTIKAYKNAADVEPPEVMIPEGETEFTSDDYSKLNDIDDEQVITDSDEKFPYHRFEVSLDEEALQQEMVELVWHGASLDGRKVNMYSWNFETDKWTVVDSFVPDSEERFTLSGEVLVGDYVREDKLNVIIQDEIPPRGEYDYTFVWLSDTQFYTEVFPELYETQVGWIKDHKDEMDIEYVFHTGDIVNTYNQMYQWEFADQFMGVLEDSDIPYGVLAGNHDVELPNMGYDNYYQYFGADRFQDESYFGGSYENNRGHYDLISTHGTDFIMVYMGWQPDDEGIAWMNEVLAKYPDRLAILNFHQYLDGSGKRTPIADRLFDEVVVPNENVKLVLGGHHHGSEVLTDAIDDNGDGTDDREVYQLLGNFQDANRGGDGFMNIMNMDTENNLIYINTYSTDLDSYDLFEPYTISLDLEPMTKRVATDYFEVNAYSNDEIGRVNDVQSGNKADILWEDLEGERTYYWYASVKNEDGEEAKSSMWHFSTTADEGLVEIGDIHNLVEEFIVSGDIENPLSSQLINTARQAEHHYDKGNMKQAIKFIDKFLEQLDKKQQHISRQAKEVLEENANKLLDVWRQ